MGTYTDTLAAGEEIEIGGVVFNEQNPSGQVMLTGASANGCDSLLHVELTFLVLTVDLSYGDPNCFDSHDGYIRIDSIPAGKGPFLISLDGAAAVLYDSLPILFDYLAPGIHELQITDANDISITLEITLQAPAPPVVTAPEVILIQLGEDAPLDVQYSFTPDSLLWQPATYLDDPSSPDPVAIKPLDDISYELTAFDVNGCSTSAGIQVVVRRDISAYVPNAFSPNGDGINDVFMVFGGPAVVEVDLLRIFDRWGNQLFSAEHFPPNEPAFGWNGYYRGQAMNPGVYVYHLRLRLIDGSTLNLKGDLVLVK